MKDEYKGLNEKEISIMREKYGENKLKEGKQKTVLQVFAEQFKDLLVVILIIAAIISAMTGGIEGTIVIIAVLIMNAILGTAQHFKAQKSLDSLKAMSAPNARVIRDGEKQEIAASQLVPGDILLLEAGDVAAADGRILENYSLQVNESTLTGEPLISKTTIEDDFDPEATYPSNQTMRGTTVVDGHGIMQVQAVGDATEYGKVNQGAQMDNNLDTPLQLQLKRLAGIISKAGYTIAALTFLVLTAKVFLQGGEGGNFYYIEHILNNFMIAVTLVVVSVPEGLPMSVTLSLALSMNRMLKANNLVRKMHACETMGATTVICTDKTGTLTQNQMRVNTTSFFPLKEQKLAEDNASMLIREGIAVNSTANLNRTDGTVHRGSHAALAGRTGTRL